ncbi:hypothetical protein [Alkaliphilus crotonatoxidans]
MEKEKMAQKLKEGVLDELDKHTNFSKLLLNSDDDIVIQNGKCRIKGKNKNIKLVLCDVVINTDQCHQNYAFKDDFGGDPIKEDRFNEDYFSKNPEIDEEDDDLLIVEEGDLLIVVDDDDYDDETSEFEAEEKEAFHQDSCLEGKDPKEDDHSFDCDDRLDCKKEDLFIKEGEEVIKRYDRSLYKRIEALEEKFLAQQQRVSELELESKEIRCCIPTNRVSIPRIKRRKNYIIKCLEE